MFDEDEEEDELLFKPKTYLVPQKGDKFFIRVKGDYNVSFLSPLQKDMHLYITGYKEAADVLVENMLEHREHLDTFVFPALFLYRHFIELNLKLIIREGDKALDNPPKSKDEERGFPLIHPLIPLWKRCEDILKNPTLDIVNEPTLEAIEAMRELINEYSEVDPDSFVFRYPMDKKNRPSLPNLNRSFVSMPHIKEIVKRMDNFFVGVHCQIEACLEGKHDMETWSYE